MMCNNFTRFAVEALSQLEKAKSRGFNRDKSHQTTWLDKIPDNHVSPGYHFLLMNRFLKIEGSNEVTCDKKSPWESRYVTFLYISLVLFPSPESFKE